MDLAVERVPVERLTPHPRNPRRGNVSVIAESLSVNGQYRPIVVATDDVVLAGNHTLQAALSLGWTDIAVVRVPCASDSPEAARIMLADNRASDLGIYDDASLLDLLHELEEDAGALAGTGYGDDDLAALARLVAAQDFGRVDHDAEWVGMPEFSSENLPQAVMRVTVHIHTEEDVGPFFAAIGKPRRSIIWWPDAWDDAQRCFSGDDKPRMVAGADAD